MRTNIGNAVRSVAKEAAAAKMAYEIDTSTESAPYKPGQIAYWMRYTGRGGNPRNWAHNRRWWCEPVVVVAVIKDSATFHTRSGKMMTRHFDCLTEKPFVERVEHITHTQAMMNGFHVSSMADLKKAISRAKKRYARIGQPWVAMPPE
jgi:hypothetical protein